MNKEFDISKYKTVSQAAKTLGYTPSNITHMIRKGKLRAIKRGRRYFILEEDILAQIITDPFFS